MIEKLSMGEAEVRKEGGSRTVERADMEVLVSGHFDAAREIDGGQLWDWRMDHIQAEVPGNNWMAARRGYKVAERLSNTIPPQSTSEDPELPWFLKAGELSSN